MGIAEDSASSLLPAPQGGQIPNSEEVKAKEGVKQCSEIWSGDICIRSTFWCSLPVYFLGHPPPPAPNHDLHFQNLSGPWGWEGRNLPVLQEFSDSPEATKHLKTRRREEYSRVGLLRQILQARLYGTMGQRLGQKRGVGGTSSPDPQVWMLT